MSNIRPAAIAGSFYPADRPGLTQMLNQCFKGLGGSKERGIARPHALIVPHAGYVYSGRCAASAYSQLDPSQRNAIKRVLLLGPAHRVALHGCATSSADHWETPMGSVELDRAYIEELRKKAPLPDHDLAHEKEHSLEIHLPILQGILGPFKWVPIIVGKASAQEVATYLEPAWDDPETLIVISTDLSHFHTANVAEQLDQRTANAIEALNYESIAQGQACGRIPVSGLLHLAREKGAIVKRTSLYHSGHVTGDHSRVVGYGAWLVLPKDQRAETDRAGSQYDRLMTLAKTSIQEGLKQRSLDDIHHTLAGDFVDLSDQGAVFVTLEKSGRLRGCIGSVQAHRPLHHDIIENSYKAAFSDPRFSPLAEDELKELTISLSIMGPMEAMSFQTEAQLLGQMVPHHMGLLIRDGNKQALFLPQVWQQIPAPSDFLKSLKRKAGLPLDHWSENFKAWRFFVEKTPQIPFL